MIQERCGRLPDGLIACVGGGSNAIGMFAPFIDDEDGRLIGVEAGGNGDELGQHAARFEGGTPGVFQGMSSVVLQNEDGQVMGTHSISAGLDYAAIGPQHAYLREIGRAEYMRCSDAEALGRLSPPLRGRRNHSRLGKFPRPRCFGKNLQPFADSLLDQRFRSRRQRSQ